MHILHFVASFDAETMHASTTPKNLHLAKFSSSKFAWIESDFRFDVILKWLSWCHLTQEISAICSVKTKRLSYRTSLVTIYSVHLKGDVSNTNDIVVIIIHGPKQCQSYTTCTGCGKKSNPLSYFSIF